MLGSFKIGSVLGITVRVHWMFLALVGFLLLLPGERAPQQTLSLLVMLSVLFGVVFLHELGHSLMARRFGIRVYDITFWPLGGMARMSEIPEQTRVELLIAIAGPAVNFLLAALVAPLFIWSAWAGSGAADMAPSIWIERTAALSSYFLWVNLMLGVFNLIPAFPMDGGRVLRAWLGRSGDWVLATERAVKVGRVFAVLMIVLGLVYGGRGLAFLPLIGVFVWFTGARELWSVRLRHGQLPFGRRPAGAPAAAFGFGGPGAGPFREAEVVSSGDADEASPKRDPTSAAARRPGAGFEDDELGGPLDDQAIERLERFRGPLRQFRPGE